MSPNVMREGPYRVYFYAGDGEEPAHVHVSRDYSEAKFWLSPVRLSNSDGFNKTELGKIQKILQRNESTLKRNWDEYFNG